MGRIISLNASVKAALQSRDAERDLTSADGDVTASPRAPAGLVLPTSLVMKNQEDSLYKARERKLVEVICRMTGRTDYATDTIHDLAQKECEVESEFFKRGKWKEYDDGSMLFSFDGKEAVLFGPIVQVDGHLMQSVEELYDKRGLRSTHHTKEEEAG